MNATGIESKKLIIFDLDGTLAPSKSPLEPIMAELMIKLLAKVKVAVISGGGYPQFQQQFLSRLPATSERYSHLLLLPTSGTQLFTWKGEWHQEYAETISSNERKRVIDVLKRALKIGGYVEPQKVYGEIIEDRGSQITFSGLGQSAPLAAKLIWDPDHSKRKKIVEYLEKNLPTYDCRIGGTTSIDITSRGVNKSFGIRKLENHLHVHIDEMLFVGDALFQGGNDFPAKATGVDCIQVKDPTETAHLIASWVH